MLPGDLLTGALELIGADLYVHSARDGRLLWEQHLQDRQLGTPPVFVGRRGLLYTVGFLPDRAASRAVLAFAPRTGRLVRKLSLPTCGRGTYVRWRRDGDWLLIGDETSPATLFAVDLARWRVARTWHFGRADGNIKDLSAGRRRAVVILDREGTREIRLLDLRSGRTLDAVVRSGPVIYLPDRASRVIEALSLDSGRTLWRHVVPAGHVVSLQAFGQGARARLLLGLVGAERGLPAFALLDGTTGRRLWIARTDSFGARYTGDDLSALEWRVFAPGVLGAIGHSQEGAEVFALSEGTGRVLWRRRAAVLSPETGRDASCGFVSGEYAKVVLLRLHFGTSALSFIALDPATGRTVAKAADPAGVTYCEVAASDGRRLYFVRGTETIVALRVRPDRSASAVAAVH